MNLVVRHDRIYRQVFYDRESHFSSIAKKELAKVLPDFVVLDFSPYILGDEGSRSRPDLALVHKQYRMWAVVEVELDTHSLEHHIEPQIRTFATGRYDESHARYIFEKDPSLNLDYLYNLIPYSPPTVVVVVNSRSVLTEGWANLETEYSARLTFVESFRADNDDVIVSISGYLPTPPAKRIMKLRKQEMMNALVCRQPGDIPATTSDSMCMYWRNRPYVWPVVRTKDMGVFFAPSGVTIRSDRNYQVSEIGKNAYQLHEL